MAKATREWYLWVHKATQTYYPGGTCPVIGGKETNLNDFEWVVVREVHRKAHVKKSLTRTKR